MKKPFHAREALQEPTRDEDRPQAHRSPVAATQHEMLWGSRGMNLQLFAEPDVPGGAPQPELTSAPLTPTPAPIPTPPAPEGQPGAQQMFTVEDVQKLIQSEADKRVTQALAKQKKEYEKKLSLTGLDEQQRALAERDQTIEELKEQLREASAKQLKADLVQALAGRGLPTSFADLIDVGEDAAEAQRRVEALDAGFRAAVEEAVKARLSGGAPGRGGTKPPMTREEFRKLPLSEMQKLAKENPELYKQLTTSP